ncbi:MAG: hypothetical protein U1E70_15615 [Acetobacteraceae bacterium]|nr:hypothetical protein [Pseudomonadota bacterium]
MQTAKARSVPVAAIGVGAAVALAGVVGGLWLVLHAPSPPAQVANSIAAPAAPPMVTAPAPAAPQVAAPVPTASGAVASAPPAAQATPAPTPPIQAAAPEFAVIQAPVDAIRRNTPTDMTVFRLAENPNVIVLDFASLEQQGRMLDRVAALTEKRSQPRDRIVTSEELNKALRSEASPSGWFYYGHDYSAAQLNRFFDLAARERMPLTPEEATLARLLTQLGWRNATSSGALISIPRLGADSNVTPEARNTILTHELSHGEYFSNPAYADYVHRFFLASLTAPEREAFRTFLAREGYDRDNPEVVENETHAYLLFTADSKFFTPKDVGMTPARRADLRALFLRDMPAGWLKDLLARLP